MFSVDDGELASGLMPKRMADFAGVTVMGEGAYDVEDAKSPHDLEPILELTVALARDIPNTFYKSHFYNLLPCILYHRNSLSADQIEKVFQCVSVLLYILNKPLIQSPLRLYTDHFAELLSSRERHCINDLAAQSLAHLVKKTVNKEAFIYDVFKRLRKDPSQEIGLGKLFTCVMKSNQLNRLHSCTPSLLRIMLNSLMVKSIPTEVTARVITSGLEGLALFIEKKNPHKNWYEFWKQDSEMVWGPIWKQMEDVLKVLEEGASDNDTADSLSTIGERLSALFEILEFLITFKKGVLIIDFDSICDRFSSIIQLNTCDELGQCLSKIVLNLIRSHVVMTKNVKSSDEPVDLGKRVKLIELIFEGNFSRAVMYSFIRGSLDLKNFKTDFLPKVLKYLHDLPNDDPKVFEETLTLLFEIIMKYQPPIKTAEEIHMWSVFPLDFSPMKKVGAGKDHPYIPDLIKTRIISGLDDDVTNWQVLSMCIMCFPHLFPLDQEGSKSKSRKKGGIKSSFELILKDAISRLKTNPNELNGKCDIVDKIPTEISKNLLYLIGILVETMAHSLDEAQLLQVLSSNILVTFLNKNWNYRENVHLLRAIDLHFSIVTRNDTLDVTMFPKLYKTLSPALASASSQVRLFVTHILSMFELELPAPPEGVEHVDNMFAIMFQIESFHVTPLNYREKIRLMTSLDTEHVAAHSPVSNICIQAPLLFAIGQLYVNLTPLWSYTEQFIADMAEEMPQEHFWDLWFVTFKKISSLSYSRSKRGDQEKVHSIEDAIAPIIEVNNYLLKSDETGCLAKHINYSSVCNLMWRAMHKFPQVCEKNSGDIMVAFFDFMKNILKFGEFHVAPTQNLTVSKSDLELDDDTDELEGDSSTLDESTLVTEVNSRAAIDMLNNFLSLLASFNNLKSIPNYLELQNMCMDLLVHPNTNVNQHALKCIIAFKNRHINPYKEKLLEIQKDKSGSYSSSELCIDNVAQNSNVADSHRKRLIPIFIRILYSKIGKRSSKNIIVRKANIVRLLSGITDEESSELINLMFEILLPHLNGTVSEVVDHESKEIDASNCIPLKHLRGMVGTLENVLQYLGNLIPSRQTFFLKVILFLFSYVNHLRFHNENVDRSFKPLLKKISSEIMELLLTFFEIFPDYCYTAEEMDVLFEVAVWPNIDKLVTDGSSNDHPLLRMFAFWSNSYRWHALFMKHQPEKKEMTCLVAILSLAAGNKCKKEVISKIIEIINNLLSTGTAEVDSEDTEPKKLKSKANDETEETLPDMHWNDLLPIIEPKKRTRGTEKPSYGLKMLLPHVSLLSRCFEVIVNSVEKKNGVDKVHLKLICQLSEYIYEESVSMNLLSLLVTVVMKGKVHTPEIALYLLDACANLLPYTTKVSVFASKLLNIFDSYKNETVRKAVTQVFSRLSKEHPRYKVMVELMQGLNAWDAKALDVMDVERRVKTYQRATNVVVKEEFDCDVTKFLVYQIFFDLRNIKNAIIENSSIKTLHAIMKRISVENSKSENKFCYIIAKIISSKILAGCKLDTDVMHTTHMKILGDAALEIHDLVPELKGVKVLHDFDQAHPANKIDFFKDLSSTKVEERSKGLQKLSACVKDGSLVLKQKTFDTYIWPIITRYISKEQYENNHNLRNMCVTCTGVFALNMSWDSYSSTLNYFLSQLQGNLKNTKIGVQAVCVILDAFHENVSHLEVAKKNTVKPLKSKNKVSAKKKKNKDLNGSEDTDKSHEDTYNLNDTVLMTSIDKVSDSNNKKRKLDLTVSEDMAPVLEAAETKTKEQAYNKKVYHSLVQNIIPKLKKQFGVRNKELDTHKGNKKHTKNIENTEKNKISLALPIVKLLKKFHKAVLDSNISNIIYSLCTHLKSYCLSISKYAKETLADVIKEIGGSYLPCFIRDIRNNFNLGFTKIVGMNTVKYVMEQSFIEDVTAIDEKASETKKSLSYITCNDIARCVPDIMFLCVEELFPNKDPEFKHDDTVEKRVRIEEAKGGEKSFPIIQMMGKLIKKESMEDILLTLKSQMETTHKMSVVTLVRKCLMNLRRGLKENLVIDSKQKLILTHGIITNKIAKTEAETDPTAPVQKSIYDRPDNYLLEPLPKRQRISAKITRGTNTYIVKEFALDVLCDTIESQLNPNNVDHCGLLDPFVKFLSKFIKSDSPKVSLKCVKVIIEMVKFKLPSWQENAPTIVGQLFVVLNKYSTGVVEEGEISDWVDKTFAALDCLLKNIPSYSLTVDHARVLLIMIRENLVNHQNPNTIFSLLSTIINRNIQAPEMNTLVEVLKTIIVKSDDTDKAKSAFEKYFLNYPLTSNQIVDYLTYFRDNLDYGEVRGRLSVTKIFGRLISQLPSQVKISKDLLLSFWSKLTQCMIGEDDKDLKNYQKATLFFLFKSTDRKELLITESLRLMKESKSRSKKQNILFIRLGVLSLTSFLSRQSEVSDPKSFYPKMMLSEIVPCVTSLMNNERFKAVANGAEDDEWETDEFYVSQEQHLLDIYLVEILDLFEKLYKLYGTEEKKRWNKAIDANTWNYIAEHMLYEYFAVSLQSTMLLGKLFSEYLDSAKFPCIADTSAKVRSLVIKLRVTFITDIDGSYEKSKKIAMQSVKNLIFLIKQSDRCTMVTKVDLESDGVLNELSYREKERYSKLVSAIGTESDMNLSATWVLQGMAPLVKPEISKNKTLRRECLLNLIKGVVMIMGNDLAKSSPAQDTIIDTLASEQKHAESEVKYSETFTDLITEVSDMMQEIIGTNKFCTLMAKKRKSHDILRGKRRVAKQERVLKNPSKRAAEEDSSEDEQMDVKRIKV